MDDDVVVRIDGLWKRYGMPYAYIIGHYLNCFTKADVRGLFRIPRDTRPWALKDISLEVRRGEMLGIIGKNGAGKSTLLKVLCGVTPPTKGDVYVNGRVFPMIELTAGVHWELTGRENARVLAAIMGLSREEIDERIPVIEEFCDIGEWFDKPFRMYSSGMQARLGFSVAIHTNAEILLVDEALAVGDIGFRQKCLDWLDKNRGKITVLFVSHWIGEIERVCDRLFYMDRGQAKFTGPIKEGSILYWDNLSDDMLKRMHEKYGTQPKYEEGTADISIMNIKLGEDDGTESKAIHKNNDLNIELDIKVWKKVSSPNVMVKVSDHNMMTIAHSTTLGELDDIPDLEPGDHRIKCVIKNIPLLRGTYVIDISILDSKGAMTITGMRNAAQFKVIETSREYSQHNAGYLYLPSEWRYE
ncbi:MAG: ABC transporter ATP-binding protein [Candidatus Altiarchaeota archaeon]